MFRAALFGALALTVACSANPTPPPSARSNSPSPTPSVDPVIAAAGDIACDPDTSAFNDGKGKPGACRQRYTSDLLVGRHFTAVLALGDNQYEIGGLSDYRRSYDPSWGRLRSITYPVSGNHEYNTPRATGYYAFFG